MLFHSAGVDGCMSRESTEVGLDVRRVMSESIEFFEGIDRR